MSCTALSPFSGSKRLFEEHSEDIESPCDRGQGKRGRYFAGSPSGRCSGPSPAFLAVHPATLEALRGLFPGMDDQAVTAVLAECGNDIDAAIRRLNHLRIEAGEQQQAQGQPQQLQQQQQQQQRAQREQAAPLDPEQQQQAEAAAAAQQQQQQQQQQASAPAAAAAAQQAAAAAAGPQTAEQWVDALVGEMAQAASIPDARGRAAKLLHSFEQFVGGRGAPTGPLQARLDEAQRENAILKRAVQIQNGRMQEAAAREHELAALKAAVAQYQERLRHLEMSNYSLALHLQKATGDAPVATGHRPPDVY